MAREKPAGRLSLDAALAAAKTPSGRYSKVAVERLVLRFLRTARLYGCVFGDVQLRRDSQRGDAKSPVTIVAEGHDGATTAIMCHIGDLGYAKAAGFLEAITSEGFGGSMLVHIDGKVAGRARRALEDAGTAILSCERLEELDIDWGFAAPPKAPGLPGRLTGAVNAVARGLAHADRGIMVMPPGTGRALVALGAAEQMAGRGGAVLVVAPSLASMNRTMRQWADAATIPLSMLAAHPGEHRGESAADSYVPVADPKDMSARYGNRTAGAMTVVFSTYESAAGMVAGACGGFDLAIYGDAHTTAGNGPRPAPLPEIDATRRLYITAAPKMPEPHPTRTRRAVYAMDEETYGREIYRLDLGEAIGEGAAADFMIKVVLVSGRASKGLYQRSAGSVPAAERAVAAAAWRAILNPGGGRPPLRSITGVVRSARRAKEWAAWLARLAKYAAGPPPARIHTRCAGSNPREDAGWLEGPGGGANTCRALFAQSPPDGEPVECVLFADAPSVAEAERCVGGVVRRRRGAGKERGHLLVPIALGNAPVAEPPDATLRAAWTVLAAACAHDGDLRRELAALELEEAPDARAGVDGSLTIQVGGRIEVDVVAAPGELDAEGAARLARRIRRMFVERAGGAGRYGEYAGRLAEAAGSLETQMAQRVADSPLLAEKIEPLVASLKRLVGDSATQASAARIMAQHMVFGGLLDTFHNGEFVRRNPVARAIQGCIATLGFDQDMRIPHDVYNGMHTELRHVDTAERRRNFVLLAYEAYRRLSEPKPRRGGRLPAEIVGFVIRSVQHVLDEEFGASLDDRSTRVLDPFAGAGTFVSGLLEVTSPDSMHGKYEGEIYAGECSLAAYYATTARAEFTRQMLGGRGYVPFAGASYADTFGSGDRDGGPLLADAAGLVARQHADNVRVIVGDPPRSTAPHPGGRHPELETRIRNTYVRAARRTGHSGSTIDVKSPYVRAQRWATDRLRGSGVVGFVVPAEYIVKDSKAGLRACLREEFTDVWCYDLRGGGASAGDGAAREIVVVIMVRNPKKAGHSVHYARVSRRYGGRDKLDHIKKTGSIAGVSGWRVVPDSRRHRWVRQRDV
ncbi:MAG: hypothetical protein J4G04_05700 [Nitrosopumilaceae archaeon]|nr:hypothetical protein [Nitrosopumilaceae archaeon]